MIRAPRRPTRRRRWPELAACGALQVAVLLACTAACDSAAPGHAAGAVSGDSPPDLLLITVDTLRPDALGWVAGRNPTPALDRLAAGGFRFPAAVAPVPLTLPSHTSLMTALAPPRHGVRDNGQVLGVTAATLAESLAAGDYATAAFVSGFPLAAEFGLDRGFGHYDDRLSAGEGAWLERPAADTTRAAVEWLSRAGGDGRPWAVWVHYYDPHYPYSPPPGLARRGERGAYDGEVVAVDRAVGELLRAAEALSSDSLLTVFTADHGESLGEHGEGTHGFFVYDSTMLVPLVVRLPGRVRPGSSRAPARLVDVAPTILDLLGLPPLAVAGGLDGVSLLPLLAGEERPPSLAYLETRQPWSSYGWAPLAAARDGRFKLIVAPRPELYDLARDPGEERNLLVGESLGTADGVPGTVPEGEAAAAARRLRAHVRQVASREVTAAEVSTDGETRDRLAALGYLAGTGTSGEPPDGLADPKDRVAVREVLTAGDELLRGGRTAEALRRFDSVLAAEPDNRFALARSGIALQRLGRLEEAVRRLRRSAIGAGADAEIHAALAESLLRAGRPAEAAEEWAEVVRLHPRRAAAWSSLGTALGRAGRPVDAAAAMERAVALEPGSPELRARLAFAAHAAGRKAAAAAHLEAAAALAPDRFDHAGALGLILAELDRTAAARPWLAASGSDEPEFPAARYRLAELAAAAGEPAIARRALTEATSADPTLASRAAADPRLAPLLDGP